MHVAFAVFVFLLVALQETLSRGVFGATQTESELIVAGAMLAAAGIILRGDIRYLIAPPPGPLYGSVDCGWSIGRSVLGCLLAPLILIVPILWVGGVADLDQRAVLWIGDVTPVAVVIALASGVFFREAALSAFGGSAPHAAFASGLAVFVMAMGAGLQMALLAAASGVYLMALRLIGCNILVLTGLHVLLVVAVADLGPVSLSWTYVILFTSVATGLAIALLKSFRQIDKGVFAYA